MNKFRTAEEFEELQALIKAGRASIEISRSISRQFFMRVSNASVKSTTGHSVILQKILVWSCQGMALLLLLLCGVIIANSFGWWATIGIPIVGTFWAILAGLTNEDGDWLSITIILMAAVGSFSLIPVSYWLPLIIFVLSLWLHRMTYILAQNLLIPILVNSYDAYDMLVDNIELRESSATEFME